MKQQGAPDRKVATGREFIILLTCLMASAALSIDLMLPAFPEMRQEFGMSPDSTQVSWIVTSYFLGLAVGPWLYGPASDRYGRRAPLFAGLTLFIVGALLASVAPSWGWVIAARFIWGLGTAAPRALSTAMIRDRYEGSAMAQLMSRMVAVFLLVPILAPSIGAGLINIAPWRIVFWVPAGAALILMIWSRRLPETLALDKRRPFTWSAVGQAGREVLTHRATLSFIVAMTFLFAVMTTYLSGSEVIVEDVYGYGSWFPLIFGTLAVLLAINSLNNARIVQRMGINKLVRQSALVGVGTSLLLYCSRTRRADCTRSRAQLQHGSHDARTAYRRNSIINHRNDFDCWRSPLRQPCNKSVRRDRPTAGNHHLYFHFNRCHRNFYRH